MEALARSKPGEVKEGVDPIGPSGDKAVKGTEGFAGPDVEAALLRKAGGKLVDDQRSGDEKEYRGQDPQADGRGSVVAGGGDPARAENGGDVEEKHVPEAHGFAELRLGIEWGGGDDWHGVTWRAERISSWTGKTGIGKTGFGNHKGLGAWRAWELSDGNFENRPCIG